MTGEQYLLLGFLGGLGVLWGYAIDLWITSWALRRRERDTMHTTTKSNDQGANSMTHTARLVATIAVLGLLGGAGPQNAPSTPPKLPAGHPETTPTLPSGHPPLMPPLPSGHPPIGTPSPRDTGQAQTVIPSPADVATVDAIVTSYYESISGRRDVPRDWSRFRSLFMPDARLVAMRDSGGRGLPIVLSVEDYISGSDAYYMKSGYHEAELHRVTNAYGGLGQVLSTFASRRGTPDAAPYARGMNSMQLLFDGERWWIVTIMWDHERSDRPIPPEYLPAGGEG